MGRGWQSGFQTILEVLIAHLEKINEAVHLSRENELTNDRSSFSLVLNGSWAADATLSSEEGREINSSLSAIGKCSHADTFGLEIFKRSRDIQEALAPRTDDSHWGPAQLSKISYTCR
jgi:hypothetical protein